MILGLGILEKQKRLLLVIIITAICSGGFVYILIAPNFQNKSIPIKNSAPIHTPGATVQSNEVWMQQMSQESKTQNQKIELLEKIVTNQALTEKPSNTELDQIKQDLDVLKKKINQSAANEGEEPAHIQHTPMIKHSLSLRNARYRVGQRIPPGTYVKAILLSAVDASVGSMCQVILNPFCYVFLMMLLYPIMPTPG